MRRPPHRLTAPSALAATLDRSGPLPCRAVGDHERLRAGEILVAPPDRHVVVQDGRVALSRGPRENGHRPSIDALFRSAAQHLDGHVIGVVPSGTRDDGTAGLAVIKARGGLAVVQDPAEALYPGMPRSAITHVDVDAIVPAAQIGPTLVDMLAGEANDPPAEIGSVQRDPPRGPVITTCPDCGGVLSEHREAGLTVWRCKVGHRYSPQTLADAQAKSVESAIWAAVRALEDRHQLLTRMAEQAAERGAPDMRGALAARAGEALTQARAIRGALEDSLAGTLRAIVEEAADDAGSDAADGPAREAR